MNLGNTGIFFRYANSKLKTRVSVAPLKTPSGDVSSDPTVKAELLNDYFSSTFQIDNNVILTALLRYLHCHLSQDLQLLK